MVTSHKMKYRNYPNDGFDYGYNSKFDDILIKWALGTQSFPSHCADFICNGDAMFHTNKG